MKKKKIIKSISVIASILFVFFITFYISFNYIGLKHYVNHDDPDTARNISTEC